MMIAIEEGPGVGKSTTSAPPVVDALQAIDFIEQWLFGDAPGPTNSNGNLHR